MSTDQSLVGLVLRKKKEKSPVECRSLMRTNSSVSLATLSMQQDCNGQLMQIIPLNKLIGESYAAYLQTERYTSHSTSSLLARIQVWVSDDEKQHNFIAHKISTD